MPLLSKFRCFWINVFRRRAVEDDLDGELQSHLGELIDRKLASGLSPDAARRAAFVELGGVSQVKESVRDVRSEFMFDAGWQDIRYGVRRLLRNRGFAVSAVLTLAVGVASATTVFTFVQEMMLAPPVGVVSPDRVFANYMRLEVFDPDYGDYRGFSYPQFEALRDVQDVYSQMVWYARRQAVISVGEYAESLSLELVMGEHFPMLGTVPALGRLIDPGDNVPGGPALAVISHTLWQSRFNGRPDVLNETVSIDGQDFSIIGVAPEGYIGIDLDWNQFPQVWAPLHNATILNPASAILTTRGAWMRVLGRLNPEVSPAAAEARLTQLLPVVNDPSDRYRPDFVEMAPLRHARINPRMRGEMTNFFAVLMTVSVLILLAACFNVGSFLIGQAATRRHEMAVRLALGASRARLVRQLLTECTVLGLSATLAGVLLSLFMARMAETLPGIFGFQLYSGESIDPAIFVFALVLGLLTTFIFGLIPALLVSGRDPWRGLRHISEGWSGRFGLSARQCVLVSQVTLAVLLAVTGALFTKSLYNLLQLDPGFVADRLLLAQINEVKIPTEQRESFDRELLLRLRALPGVLSASISAFPPTDGGLPRLQFRDPAVDQETYFMAVELVGADYFKTTGTPLTLGHEFTDTSEDETSVIINEVLANRLWPGDSPLGKVVETNGDTRQVIGVVPLLNCWNHFGDPDPCVFVPLDTRTTKTVEVKVAAYAGMADVVRRTVHELNPSVLVPQIKTVEEHIRGRLSVEIVATIATGVLAILGVLLSAIGCYAVFSSMVKERTREIALRLALGAPVSRLLGVIVAHSLLLCALGIAAGLVFAVLLGTRFEEQLFQVRSWDVGVLVTTSLLMIVVAIVASVVAGRTIARTDPASALKVT